MKSKWLILNILGCSAFFFLLGAMVEPKDQQFAGFDTMSQEQLEQTLNQQTMDRQHLESQIVDELKTHGHGNAMLAAIYLAGVYRMDRACPELTQVIDIHYPPGIIKHLPAWSEYPAVDAMVQIGSPAIPYLVGNLGSSDNKDVRRLSADALQSILGVRLAKDALREAMEGQGRGDQAVTGRLEAAVLLLK